MLNFIKVLAAGRRLQDHEGLIWSHNHFLFDYQLLIEALNWPPLNTAACEDVLGAIRPDRKWDWIKEELADGQNLVACRSERAAPCRFR